MRYEWWIAKRYLWSKRRHPFVGVISAISVIGIAVGVGALIVVLAVMNGFDEDLKARIIGMRAHVTIEKEGVFTDYAVLANRLAKIRDFAGVAPFIEGQALMQKGELGCGVLVRGVDPTLERSASKFHGFITRGALTDRPGGAVVGSELAKHLNLAVGSRFQMLSQTSKKPVWVTVEGLFSSGLYDYDANLVFLNLKSAQDLFDMQQGVSGLSLALKNPDRAGQVKRALQKRLGFPYTVRTWIDLNKTLFGALKLEKATMFLILALIIFVACLNIAGSLTILVMDKTRDIGILKAIGVSAGSLVKIFALDGLMLGLVGSVVGLGTGLGLCALLRKYTFVDLPREIYYLDKLPVRINPKDTALVLVVAVVLSFVSAIYPARMAGRLDPVKALRYE